MSTVTVSRREVAWHEASHVSSLLLDGLVPLVARLDLWPDEPQIGSVRIDWESLDLSDRRVLKAILVATLMGPIADAEPLLTLIEWPVDPDAWQEGSRRDAEVAAFLVDRLGFDLVDWNQTVFHAGERAKDFHFRTLAVKIRAALEEKGELYRHELAGLAERVLG